MRQPTLLLQSVYRSIKVAQIAKHSYLIERLRSRIVKTIVKVQAHIRSKIVRKRAKGWKLIQVILSRRNEAALVIQKHYKRYITQHLYEKVLELERNYIALKWLPSNSSQASLNYSVEVVGSFTTPPWGKKVELDFCPLRGIFVKYINNLQEGVYLIKFIVNGEYKCDDHLLPTATDSSGHINNVLEIGYDSETDQYSIQSSLKREGSAVFNQPYQGLGST